jgi:LysR family transcriptional regulator, regulator for metE and metH
MAYLDRRHYQLLLAIRRHGRLSVAAQSIGLTQSAASHQIKEAERRLAIRLFAYEGRNVVLTAAAERLVKAAIFAEDTLILAESDAARIHQGAGSTIRLAIGFYDHIHWLAAVVRTLQEAFKKISIEIVTLDEAQLRTAVLSGIADLFIGLEDEDSNLPAVALFPDRLVRIGPSLGSRPADSAQIPWAAFPRIAFSRQSALPGQPNHFGVQLRAPPQANAPGGILRVESAMAIVELVAANLGTSLLPHWCVAPDLAAGKIAELDDDANEAPVTWHLYGDLTQLDQGERIRDVLLAALRSAHGA